MAFIFLKTDAFAGNFLKIDATRSAGREKVISKDQAVRRPYRGIQIKEDTYSSITVRRPDGSAIPLTSSSDIYGNTRKGKIGQVEDYSDYILQSVQEQRMEKQQIIETFGDPYVYFFGERPRIIQFSGQLVSTDDFNWRSQFWANYHENIRGTRLVQKNARAYVSFDTIIVEGYVLNASAVDTAETPYTIPFNFSMLVTSYYDWSNIGQTTFPGSLEGMKNVEVLNQELELSRGEYVSTSAEVRYKNLTAAGATGILATLRKGIRAVNEAVGMVGGLADKIHNVIGGRNVRLPLGIAGYLQSTGAAVVAGGSLGDELFYGMYDAKTGDYSNLKGSVKLRMPGVSKFAPAWVSQVTKQPLGYIFENYDEYPTRAQPPFLFNILSLSDYADVVDRKVQRQLTVAENDVYLAMHNQIAEAGSFLGDLSEAVSFVKSNFGMIMSAVAFARDPTTILKQSLGIGVGTTSKSRIAGRSEALGQMGIKTAAQEEANKSLLERTGKWIGGSAINTFKNTATAKAENQEPASMGEVYNQTEYQQQLAEAGEGDFSYEPAYGNQNYSALVSQGDPANQATLDEAYGNIDSLSGTDVNPASLSQVYGTGSSSPSVRSPSDIAAALQQAQSNNVENDEDTSGIIGEDDVDVQIAPVI